MNAKILIADDESDIVSMLGNFFESKCKEIFVSLFEQSKDSL